MATDFRPKLLLSEISMFLIIQVLALIVGWKLIQQVELPKPPETATELVIQIAPMLIALLIATVFMLLFIKYLKGPTSSKLFFALILFVGINIVFSAFLPSLIALILTGFIIAARFMKPNVFIHNIAFFIALAGVGARLGTLLPVLAIIVLLILLSIYDFIAVFKTKHMVTMFKGMLKQGMPMGIVITENPMQFAHDIGKVSATKLRQTKKKLDFIMLGGGDLAFPALFAVAALTQFGLLEALGVIVGAVGGIILIHTLIVKKEFKALPALPPIAAFSILGFLISLLL